MDKAQRNYNIDSMKFVAACMVVLIHTSANIFQSGNNTFLNYDSYRYFLDIAVPFFFAASGIFLATREPSRFLKFWKDTLTIFLAATAFYALFNISQLALKALILGDQFWGPLSGMVSDWNLSTLTKGTVGKYHLWYLAATLVAILIIYLAKICKVKNQTILIFSTVIYFTYLTGFIDYSSVALWGGFPKALFYISLGMFASAYNTNSPRIHFGIFVGSMAVFSFLEVQGAGNITEPFLAIATLSLILTLTKSAGKESFFAKLGRKYSLSIYVLHVLFFESFNLLVILLNKDLTAIQENWYYTPVTAFAALVLSIAFHRAWETYCGYFSKAISKFSAITQKTTTIAPVQNQNKTGSTKIKNSVMQENQ